MSAATLPPAQHSLHQPTSLLVLGAIGVVFGDIGTSPLYALKEAFNPLLHSAVARERPRHPVGHGVVDGLGDHDQVPVRDDAGRQQRRGGILALLALALRGVRARPVLKWTIIGLGSSARPCSTATA